MNRELKIFAGTLAKAMDDRALESRSSRRQEAPSEFQKREFEPPDVGCYGSWVQCANLLRNSLLFERESRRPAGVKLVPNRLNTSELNTTPRYPQPRCVPHNL